MSEQTPPSQPDEASDPGSSSSDAHARCIVVTPDNAPVPRPLADALEQHNASPHHAPSAYHAITEIAQPGCADRCTLLIVEPDRCRHADVLALAAMAHAPDVAVWRYDPDDEYPVAPFVPEKPGVVPDPITDAPDDEDHDDRGHDAGPITPPTTPSLVGEGEFPAPPARDENDAPSAADGDAPLVSQDELSMLLADDEAERDR